MWTTLRSLKLGTAILVLWLALWATWYAFWTTPGTSGVRCLFTSCLESQGRRFHEQLASELALGCDQARSFGLPDFVVQSDPGSVHLASLRKQGLPGLKDALEAGTPAGLHNALLRACERFRRDYRDSKKWNR